MMFSDSSAVTVGAPTGLQVEALRSRRAAIEAGSAALVKLLEPAGLVGVRVMALGDQLHSRAPLRQA